MTVTYDQVFFADHPIIVDAAAHILVAAFNDRSAAWPTVSLAHATVREIAQHEHIAFGAFADSTLVGWIGATPSYNGNVWEIQLLGVTPEWQRNGIATTLVHRLVTAVAHAGCHTVCVWCDDESKSTSIGGDSLFPHPLDALARLESGPRHAGGFYEHIGFVRCGILPDANGPGKPDILYAKPVMLPIT
jgi:aminoglycoside 6'-N-acetyltransferase I